MRPQGLTASRKLRPPLAGAPMINRHRKTGHKRNSTCSDRAASFTRLLGSKAAGPFNWVAARSQGQTGSRGAPPAPAALGPI